MNNEEKIIPVEIVEEMQKSFLAYSMSVIVSRALPDVRDGLKPVHRRILYTMFERNLMPTGSYRKCADIVGAVLGSYHPHGDASVYDALVRLAQDFSMRYELVDGNGNFGSVDGDPPAAYRYTEAKMSKMAVEMLNDIEKDTVDWRSNYDDRLQEPVTLPARFPCLLVNGSTGIAVGMATNIPPHNLSEVIDCMVAMIDNPDISVAEMNEIMPGPDFPTAGIIMGRSGIRAAYQTGRGKVCLRGRAEIEEIKNNKFQIVITELPYQVNKQELVKSFVELADTKRIEGIDDVVDYSNRKGMRIIVELKKDVNPQVVLNQLYSFTQLQITYGIIMLALVNGVPRVLSLKEMLSEYVKYQEQIITRRTRFDLEKAKAREHILEGLKIALDFIDEVIKIIRGSKNVQEAKEALIDRFPLDEIQAQKIVEMRLGQLTGLERSKIEEELAQLKVLIADFLDILSHEERVLQIVKEESLKVRDKFADDRRTEITSVEGEVDIEDLIPVEKCVLTLTKMGYIKRIPASEYHAQSRGGKGRRGVTTREEDFAEQMFVCSSHDYVLFYSNLGRVYRLKAYLVPEGSLTSKGLNIVNVLPLESGESISAMIRVSEFEDDKYLILGTKKGIIKRSQMSAYRTNRKGGINAINIDEDDELRFVKITDGNDDLIVATKNGYAIRFNECDARPLGRVARGVKAITLRGDDEVIGVAVVREGATMLTVTETGYGRRSDPDDYRGQSRGGKGVTNYKVDKYGKVAEILMVDEDDDIIMIADDGNVIRMPVASISVYSRTAKGVRVMNFKNDAKVISVEATAKEDEQTSEQADGVEAGAVGSDGAVEITESSAVVLDENGAQEAINQLLDAADKPME